MKRPVVTGHKHTTESGYKALLDKKLFQIVKLLRC